MPAPNADAPAWRRKKPKSIARRAAEFVPTVAVKAQSLVVSLSPTKLVLAATVVAQFPAKPTIYERKVKLVFRHRRNPAYRIRDQTIRWTFRSDILTEA